MTTFLDADIETGDLSQFSGTTATTGESVTADASAKLYGSYGILATSNGGGGTEAARVYHTLASSQAEIYARIYAKVVTSGMADEDDQHTFIRMNSGANVLLAAGIQHHSGVLQWILISRNGTGWVTAYGTHTPVVGTIYCVEAHWKLGAAGSGEVSLIIDEIEEINSDGNDTNDYGNCTVVNLGGAEIKNCTSTEAYYDEIAISDVLNGAVPDVTPMVRNNNSNVLVALGAI